MSEIDLKGFRTAVVGLLVGFALLITAGFGVKCLDIAYRPKCDCNPCVCGPACETACEKK